MPLTVAAGVSELIYHVNQAVEIVHWNDIFVVRCVCYIVEFLFIYSTANAKCNHIRTSKAFKLVSRSLQLYITT